MKRLHLHVAVDDLARAQAFYATLFGAEPTVAKDDYAKWMLDDPSVNFAISARGAAGGVDHVGIQVDSAEELAELSGRLKAAGEVTFDQAATTCCYARGDKSWVSDPVGVRWETFHTFGDSVVYGEDAKIEAAASEPKAACCAPAMTKAPESAKSCC